MSLPPEDPWAYVYLVLMQRQLSEGVKAGNERIIAALEHSAYDRPSPYLRYQDLMPERRELRVAEKAEISNSDTTRRSKRFDRFS